MPDHPAPTQTTIRLDADLIQAAKRKAAEEERTLSSLIRIAIRRYIAGDSARWT